MTDARSPIWPSRIYIVRHGESAGNIAREAAIAAQHPVIDIRTRDIDVPLSPLGEQQATALGHWFAAQPSEERPTVVLTSPYTRARQTTELITRAAKFEYEGGPASVIVDERFREKEFGILDRLTKLGIEERYPDQAEFRQFLGKFYHRPPGGESWCDVILRLRNALEMICREYAGERVLLVCHSVVVLCLRYIIEQMTEDEILAIDRTTEIANCSVTQYNVDPAHGKLGQLILQRFNFTTPISAEGTPVTAAPDIPDTPMK